METIIKVNRIISYAFPVIVIIVLVIVAAVLLATFNFGLGTELTFNQCLAVCMYTSLPGVIKGLLAIMVILLGATGNFHLPEPDRQQSQRAGGSQLALPLRLLVSIDIFTIWTLLLAGLAFSCLTKVKRGTCMGVVFGWWAMFVLGGCTGQRPSPEDKVAADPAFRIS